MLEQNGVPLELCLNYDQSWINAFRSPKSTLRKKSKLRPSKEQVRLMTVTGGRIGLSLCTSSWANGDHGPLFVSLAPKSVSVEFINRMNEILGHVFLARLYSTCFSPDTFLYCNCKLSFLFSSYIYGNILYIVWYWTAITVLYHMVLYLSLPDAPTTFRKSQGAYFLYRNEEGGHFMTSETTVKFYNAALARAFDLRRAKFGLHGKPGLLVADAFTGNFGVNTGHYSILFFFQ